MTELSGWGVNHRADCDLRQPGSVAEVVRALDPASTISRGLGRSYGDPAVNAGGRVIDMTHMDHFISFDDATGVLVAEAGVSLAQILHTFAPRGWFPLVTPGTKFVTLGGCVANDVHGKAHHAQGTFSRSVDALTIMLASGEVVTATREEHADLFWATFGGMGLLGVVLTVTLRLHPIETTYFRQRVFQLDSLEAMMEALREHEAYPYAVASLDVFATGAQLGKGVLNVGEHARLNELPAALARDPLRISGPPRLGVPFTLPDFTLNPVSMRIVNALIQAIQSYGEDFAHYEKFVYPLDFVANWNRGYGRRGFTQYQFVIPFEDAPKRMREILLTIFSSGELPFLNILKQMGAEGEGVLSFPTEGFTFAIDFPIRPTTQALLRRLDAMVLDAGGRIYLGKDAFVQPDMFRAMYPAVEQWLETKAKYDPDGVFSSDLARRVGLLNG